MTFDKASVRELALFGGAPLFNRVRSTSNLVKPNFRRFMDYSRVMYDRGKYANVNPLVAVLEKRLAQLHQTRYCIAVSSGFWALVLAMKCLALPKRTEVVMPSLTYRRMADVVVWAGLKPKFCEVDPESLAITPATVRPRLNDDTALILAVHPIVNCCPAAEFEELSQEFQLPLLFDSVESAMETYRGRKLGSFGNAECFSMHASKLLNAFEGGYITTNDADLADKLKRMRNCGLDGQNGAVEFGINARLDEIHAAMALAALDDLDDQIARNKRRYEVYRTTLRQVPGVRLLEFDKEEQRGYKTIVVELLEDWPLSRQDTLNVLHAENILARPYYSPPLHLKKPWSETGGRLPNTERLAERFLLLPSGHLVTEEDIGSVARLLGLLYSDAPAINDWLGRREHRP